MTTVAEFKEQLMTDHVLYTMISEHDTMLEFFLKLENLNKEIQKSLDYNEAIDSIEMFKHTIKDLFTEDSHHSREELLFSELDSMGISGFSRFVRWEHDQLSILKSNIKECVIKINEETFHLKTDLNESLSKYLNMSRQHIFKENTVLYPLSLTKITDDLKWKEIKVKCDKIGYCSFTPSF